VIDIPPIAAADPLVQVLTDPRVPEARRYCSRCDEPVGRSRGGVPGRTEGFCPSCAHPFSFTPKLASGELVAGQYEVAGCLAHGGLGWIYLAKDRKVSDRWVVLKGLLDTGDEEAQAAAVAERRFLAEVEHPNIVKIYNFVEHRQHGYAVMEYVNGISLRGLLEQRRRDAGGQSDPLPAAHAIAYMLDILPAVGHLHSLGLLYCDFKPDNVIQTPTSLKLIDLGGVYRMDGAGGAVYGTAGYQAPEIAETGPSVSSDLYTVGRTLAVLCTDFRGYQTVYRSSLPAPDEMPLYAAEDSLYRFLVRATALDPDDRFQAADDMADQLFGVLREVVASAGDRRLPGVSTVFTGELRTSPDGPDWRTLPSPLVSPEDPAAPFLATIRADDPSETIEALRQAPDQTIEIGFRRALTYIEAGDLTEAAAELAECERRDPWDWRLSWYRGLAALAAEKPAQAEDRFLEVYRLLPGELAPKLALALVAEQCGDQPTAERWYDVVSRTEPGFTSAAFGLARCRLARSDRTGAVEALDRVPRTSSASLDAQQATVRAIIVHAADPGPTLSDVIEAAAVVEKLPEELPQRLHLVQMVLEAALALVGANGLPPDRARQLLGHPLTVEGVRLGLEATYRALARRAPNSRGRIALVDRANRVRPRTWT
jgi:serine/threonine-protein kinase PknG